MPLKTSRPEPQLLRCKTYQGIFFSNRAPMPRSEGVLPSSSACRVAGKSSLRFRYTDLQAPPGESHSSPFKGPFALSVSETELLKRENVKLGESHNKRVRLVSFFNQPPKGILKKNNPNDWPGNLINALINSRNRTGL